MSTKIQQSTNTQSHRRRRVTPRDEAEWLQAADAGDALATIAKRSSVDVRTVRQHVDRARSEKELAGVRLGLVHAAADLHQRDLLGVAAALQAVLDPSLHPLHFSLEQTPGEIRAAGKRYTALRRHTKGSGLPHALALWEAAANRYTTAVGKLSDQLQVELRAMDLDPDGTLAEMLGRLSPCASSGALPPDELPWHIQAGDLRKGAFRILAHVTALEDPGGVDAQRQYAELWRKMSAEPEVTELCDLTRSAAHTRDRVRDLLEDLQLRRYLGHAVCPWCPGSPAPPRRTIAAASSSIR